MIAAPRSKILCYPGQHDTDGDALYARSDSLVMLSSVRSSHGTDAPGNSRIPQEQRLDNDVLLLRSWVYDAADFYLRRCTRRHSHEPKTARSANNLFISEDHCWGTLPTASTSVPANPGPFVFEPLVTTSKDAIVMVMSARPSFGTGGPELVRSAPVHHSLGLFLWRVGVLVYEYDGTVFLRTLIRLLRLDTSAEPQELQSYLPAP